MTPIVNRRESPNPKRIVSFSPGPRGTSFPGCVGERGLNPNGVVASISTKRRNPVGVPSRDATVTQGSEQGASLGHEPESLWDSLNCARRIFFTIILFICASSIVAADTWRTPDHDYDAPTPGTYTLPVIKRAADGALLDSAAKPVRLAEITRGRITVLSFIYTRCAAAKACPMATGVLMKLHRESGEDAALAKHLRLVSMSFDPVNDTPARLAAYSKLASARSRAAPWHFVTAQSQTDLQPILDAYGQAVDKKQNSNDPTGPLNHTLRVFLIDAAGNIRNIYSSGTLDGRLVLADIHTLISEGAN
jgi:protein SCO1/2